MKKLLTALCATAAFSASAQTLFTYGTQSVSADEFLRAFKKNNNGAVTQTALKDYLDLYIASKLKVAEAKEKRFDTLPQLKADLENLRQQILPAYLNDKESLDKLVREAFARQQKDLRVSHIFIAFAKGGIADTVAAAGKRDEVLSKLAKGSAFGDAAKQHSDDPSAKTNAGDLGWLTAFGLPYELESVVYATPVGKTSPVYASQAGYHLFKVMAERKALGRMKAAQILLAFPPGADNGYRMRLKKTADSLYTRLQAGDDFGKLATTFSNDVVSAASNGQMQEFGVGEYSPAFENAVFALPKDGAVTTPFLTEHGYHIVRRLGLTPVSPTLTEATAGTLRGKIEGSDRSALTRNILAQKVIKQAGYQTLLPDTKELWAFTDSVLTGTKPSVPVRINPATPVAKIGRRTLMVKDWTDHAQMARYLPNGTLKTHPQLWEEFVQAAALQQYEQHLEEYNDAFRQQLTEFADGNLFFEAMQQRVWTPGQSDTAALLAHFEKNKPKYVWPQSADAVLFYASDTSFAKKFYAAVRKSPAAWRTVLNQYSEQITSDSGRVEVSQLPKGEGDKLANGALTTPVINPSDNTVSFAYLLQLHPAGEPRSFADAKGLVINDYQAELEKAWLGELRKKYPVKVEEKVWEQTVRKAVTAPQQ